MTIPQSPAQLYYSSFVPSAVREWNGLPEVAKQISSLHSFKLFLNRDRVAVSKYFYHGKRKAQVLAYTSSHGLQFLKQRFVFEKYN